MTAVSAPGLSVIIGHVMVSHATLHGEEGERRIAMLSPLAVGPAFRRRGVGAGLVRRVTAEADAMDDVGDLADLMPVEPVPVPPMPHAKVRTQFTYVRPAGDPAKRPSDRYRPHLRRVGSSSVRSTRWRSVEVNLRRHGQPSAREGSCRKRPKRADHDSFAESITARPLEPGDVECVC